MVERFALLGGLVLSGHAPGGKGQDGLLCGASAAGNCLATTMKNAQANARCGGDSGERFLRLQKSCARGKEPHFFARVAVPDHDFLHAAHAEMLAVGLVGQEGAQMPWLD